MSDCHSQKCSKEIALLKADVEHERECIKALGRSFDKLRAKLSALEKVAAIASERFTDPAKWLSHGLKGNAYDYDNRLAQALVDLASIAGQEPSK